MPEKSGEIPAETRPVSVRYWAERAKLRPLGKPYRGMLFLDAYGYSTPFPPRDRWLKEALGNLDKLPSDAFRVFRNMNGEIAIQQLRHLGMIYLV